MRSVKFLLFLAAFFSMARAASYDSLKAYVYNENASPVKGALVTLGDNHSLTDSAGSFTILFPVATKPMAIYPVREGLTFHGNVLSIGLSSPQQITVSQFDLHGRLIQLMNLGIVSDGEHHFQIPITTKNGGASLLTILRVTYGRHVSVFRCVNGNVMPESAVSPQKNMVSKLGKMQSNGLDTLTISKDGYLTRKVIVNRYVQAGATFFIHSLSSLKSVFISGQYLKGFAGTFVTTLWQINSPDTLSYPLLADSLGAFTGNIFIPKSKISNVTIAISDTARHQRGYIRSSLDSTQDSLVFKVRPVHIRGSFAPGTMGAIAATLWSAGNADTFSYALSWNDSAGAYGGAVFIPAHSTVTIVIAIRDSLKRLGFIKASMDSSQDSVTINCVSSIPKVKVRPDTVAGWGDTIALHATAFDSVDSIVKYQWNTLQLDKLKDTFIIVPMYIDSVFFCVFSAVDVDGNTASDTLRVRMTCSVRNFRIVDNEASGWVSQDAFTIYKPGRFADFLDSGALKHGEITEIAIQNMKQIDHRVLNAIVMDAGSATAAHALFDEKKAGIPATMIKTLPSRPDSMAIIDNSSGTGFVLYARFKRFFVQLTFDGFLDYNTAVINAENFLKIYEKRATKTSMCGNE